jgi:hypothetical protein
MEKAMSDVMLIEPRPNQRTLYESVLGDAGFMPLSSCSIRVLPAPIRHASPWIEFAAVVIGSIEEFTGY